MPEHSSPRPWSTLAVATLLGAALSAQQQGTSNYESALARYKECVAREPFLYQTEGRETLARTGRPEALQQLIADYLDAKDHPEYTRYTLATLFGRHFGGDESLEPLARLRSSCSKKVDVWMWVNTLKVQTDRAGDEEAMAVVRDDKNTMLRAAAIVALGRCKRANLAQALQEVCLDFPKKEADQDMLVAAMSGAILDNKGRVNDAAFRVGLRAFIGLLDPTVKLSMQAKVTMSRHLQWALNGPAPFMNPEPWLELLERGQVKTASSASTVVKQRFFGIETDGERICYVIDMSDSMCTPIDPDTKPKGPITGPQKRPRGQLPDESDIPWHKVQNRFDLAREQLRVSLQRLPKEKCFCIVWFGNEAQTLDATKGMVRASKANVDRAIAELDRFVPEKPVVDIAPYGVLKGDTNMQAGLQLAFGLTGKAGCTTTDYVEPGPISDGCDTIFLLSDGEPSRDEFHVLAQDYKEGKVVLSNEYKTEAPRAAQLHYWGPYNMQPWLTEDVIRMNAFRRLRIHCIGIGEANMGLLRALAEIGHGESFQFGQAQRRSEPGPRQK